MPRVRQRAIPSPRSPGRGAPTRAAAPYGSDLRLYAGIGSIPTLHYGPGDVRYAHAPREQVAIREVLDSARAWLCWQLDDVAPASETAPRE